MKICEVNPQILPCKEGRQWPVENDPQDPQRVPIWMPHRMADQLRHIRQWLRANVSQDINLYEVVCVLAISGLRLWADAPGGWTAVWTMQQSQYKQYVKELYEQGE